MKRPPEYRCRSQAICAVTNGLRGKAMATAVPKRSRWLCSAIIIIGKNGSCPASGATTESYPASSMRLVCSASAWMLGAITPVSTRILSLLRLLSLPGNELDDLLVHGLWLLPHQEVARFC